MQHGPRITREQKTIAAMIGIYCKKNHGTNEGLICNNCTELYNYAIQRLHHCPYQESKPTCEACTKHCYKPSMQSKVREVMRFSGPQMIFHHPVLALFHLLDGYTKKQDR